MKSGFQNRNPDFPIERTLKFPDEHAAETVVVKKALSVLDGEEKKLFLKEVALLNVMPRCRSEARCTTFHMKMSFYSNAN